MPCRSYCHFRLILIQARQMRSWLHSTCVLLGNSIAIYNLTFEEPWPHFTVETAVQRLRAVEIYLAQNLRKIQTLNQILEAGCNLCLRAQ